MRKVILLTVMSVLVALGNVSADTNEKKIFSPALKFLLDFESENQNTETDDVTTVTSTTGQVWMDRNLGASRVAFSSDDSEAYGDLYQWGRGTDGHEKRGSGTTSMNATSDAPGHGLFILVSSAPFDWRTPQNENLWQGVSGINNPCPSGYRLPTQLELNTEKNSWNPRNATGAFASPLKMVLAGYRSGADGGVSQEGGYGVYWTSDFGEYGSVVMSVWEGGTDGGVQDRRHGFSVRCIKD